MTEEPREEDLEIVEQPNGADEDGVKRQKATLLQIAKRRSAFMKSMLASPDGRDFLWHILRETHFDQVQFAAGPTGFPDRDATLFRLAEQLLGQRLYQTWFVMDPEGTMKMVREYDPRFAAPKRVRTRQE